METTTKPKITKEQAKENLKAFRKELKDRAWKRVAGSKIPDLVKVGLLMSNALSLLAAQIDVMIRAELKAEGVNAKTSGGEGDKVLVRDSDTSWKFDVFQNYEENACYSYECLGSEYEQCIPLNEHTWKLLGTMDEYKEEE